MTVDQALAGLNNIVDKLVETYCEPCKERDCDFCKAKLELDTFVKIIFAEQGIQSSHSIKCKYCGNRDKSGVCSIICRLVQDDDYCSCFDKKGSENE